MSDPTSQPDLNQPSSEPNSSAPSASFPLSTEQLMNKPKRIVHGFSSFTEMPAGVTFDTEEDDETILLFLRMHFITNLPWIASAILLLLAPYLFGYLVSLSQSPFAFLPGSFILIVQLFYYLIIAGYVFVSFITWYFNVSLITNKRVIDVDFENLIYKDVSGTKLDLVQDVSFTQVGVITTLFDFGDVLIQTAGAVDNFELKAVPKPEKVVEIVESLLGKGKEHVS